MKLTLDWLIHRSTLKDLELLTCADLADTVITGINILDNPDTVKWFHPGELVLTTGYIFLDDEKLQEQYELYGETIENVNAQLYQ